MPATGSPFYTKFSIFKGTMSKISSPKIKIIAFIS